MTNLAEVVISNEPAAIVENAEGQSDVVIICEHAGREIPQVIGTLGVDDEVMSQHVAWDIGAASVSRQLSTMLDAPLIMQRYTRLAYDCNRHFDAVDAIVEKSDGILIPGNSDLSMAQRQQRHDVVYRPFHDAIEALVNMRLEAEHRPVIVTVHSFTPQFQGQQRTIDLGVLHDDKDSRLADAVLSISSQVTEYSSARNQPYSPRDGVTHTLINHAIKYGLLNVMFEIRNNLISNSHSQKSWAENIAYLLESALSSSSLLVEVH